MNMFILLERSIFLNILIVWGLQYMSVKAVYYETFMVCDAGEILFFYFTINNICIPTALVFYNSWHLTTLGTCTPWMKKRFPFLVKKYIEATHKIPVGSRDDAIKCTVNKYRCDSWIELICTRIGRKIIYHQSFFFITSRIAIIMEEWNLLFIENIPIINAVCCL